jgi:hypothetical protein
MEQSLDNGMCAKKALATVRLTAHCEDSEGWQAVLGSGDEGVGDSLANQPPMSERHVAEEERLLKLCKQLPAGVEANAALRDDGHLPMTNFLEEQLLLAAHYIIVL